MRHGFVDERAMIKTTLMSPCHWKTHVPSLIKQLTDIKQCLTDPANRCLTDA